MILISILLSFPKENFGQAPDLGTSANFVLFSSVGAVSNTGISQLTGNVGTNSSSSTGFGNVNGEMHDNDGATFLGASDLLSAYNQVDNAIPTLFPAPLLGNGQVLVPGVYSIPSPATLNLGLTLDAQGNSNAVFIIQIEGAFSTNANAKVHLINGALACNVFWKVEGLVSMASGTTMRGTIIANNGAINMNTGDTLEGRALTTNGAITVDGVLAYTPIGCGSPVHLGPVAPALSSIICYTLFSSDGPVSNVGVTHVTGDIGTNNGLTTGYNPLFVTGMIHAIPDASTVQAASDLLNIYNYLNILPYDIELLYPAQFGNNLVLTPHTYLMNGAVTFTDTLILNAEGNSNAVFLIQINGALTTSTYSKVVLINGTEAKNVFWKVDGAVSINDYSIFKGTIVCNNGAINLMTGVDIKGRALTTTGALSTSAITAIMPPGCAISSAPIIVTEPDNIVVCEGNSAIFTVSATGTNLTYQWRKGNVNLINGGNISGVNTNTLTINPTSVFDAFANYNVVVSGDILPSDTSINVSLTLNSIPNITSEPINQDACLGGSVNFTVVATASAITYQWRKGLINLTDGGNISGSNTNTLTINPVNISDSASNYNVIVMGSCFPNDTSILVSLTIENANIIIQPINQAGCEMGSVLFSVGATGSNLTYQWKKGTSDLIDGGNISGANTDSLIINPISISDASSTYNVVVSNSCTLSDTSDNVILVVNTAPIITDEPINQTTCLGNSISFFVGAIASDLTYQWRKGNINLTTSANIADVTSDSLVINPIDISDTSSFYNVIISGSCFPNDTSVFASLTIDAPVITSEPINQTICEGNSVSFSVVATGSNNTYIWRKGLINLVNTSSISGVNTNTLTINPTSTSDLASDYNVVVSGVCLPNDTSINASLFFNTSPVITVEPSNQSACLGSSVSFSVLATGSTLTYQWMKGTIALVNAGNYTGANTNTLTINPTSNLDASSNYYVIVSGGCLPSDTSIFVSLTINVAPIITVEPTNQIVCDGSSVSFSVSSTGTNSTFQWFKNGSILTDGGNISGATTNTITINPATNIDAYSNYYVIVSGACLPSDTSIYVSLTIDAAPVITVEPINQVVCDGNSVSFSVSSTGTNATFQWFKNGVLITDGGNISGAITNNITINPAINLDASSNYYVIVSGVCLPSDTSIYVSLTIDAAPIITVEPINQIVCDGSSVSFSVSSTGTNATFQWFKNGVLITDGGNIYGAITNNMTINPASNLDASSNYYVVVSGACLPNDTSIFVSLTIHTAPIITVEPINQIVCDGSSVSFSVSSTGTNPTFQWFKNGSIITDGGNIFGATTNTLTINPANDLDAANSYYVVVYGACSPNDTSLIVSLIVSQAPIAFASCVSPVCIANSIYLNAQTIAGATYQWTGTNGFASTDQNPIISSASESDASTYTLVVSVGNCPSLSSEVIIKVEDCDKIDFNIPEGFSPNGDGINDNFVIRGIDRYPENTIVIYNRWGDKVFEASPYNNTWDGKPTLGLRVGGDELPIATYFYLLNLGNQTEMIKGTIYLNR